LSYFKYLILGVLILACANLCAQESTLADGLLLEAKTAYDDGRFDEAELAALRGLHEVETDELATIPFHALLGFVYVARDQTDFAYREFYKAVAINPAYDLDPVMISPKILEVFRRAKTDYMDMLMEQPAIYRLPQADVRMAASARSLILPGWGQYYKQQRIKGTVFIAAQVLTLAALGVLQAEVGRRHDDYLAVKGQNSPIIEDRFQEYRRAYRARNAVGFFTLGIYIVNYLDALYTPISHSSGRK
jgi:hypothetical protein